MYFIARIVLAFLVSFSFFHFANAIKRVYGPKVEKWLLIITLSQFHFMYYLGRTMPNTFGLMLCNIEIYFQDKKIFISFFIF
jgi:alpha-1,6-mannosyltransferase